MSTHGGKYKMQLHFLENWSDYPTCIFTAEITKGLRQKQPFAEVNGYSLLFADKRFAGLKKVPPLGFHPT